MISTFWRIWKVIRVASLFGVFYLGGAFAGLFMLPILWTLGRDPVRRIRRTQRLLGLQFRLVVDLMRWARLFGFDWRGAGAHRPEGACILVANHPTTIDVVAVTAVYPDVVLVVKHKIWRNILLRPLFRFCGHVDGGDGSFESNMRLVEEVKERLSAGFSVAIWPEGTRSPKGGLGELQKGAFALAAGTGLPIVPLTIRASPPVLTRDDPWHRWPTEVVDYRIETGEALPSAGRTSRQLQREVEAHYRAALGLEEAR